MNFGSDLFFYLSRLSVPPYRLLKRLGFIKRPRTDDLPVTFILSTGRTGTHFFSHFFEENFSSVYALHEPPWDIFDINREYLLGNIPENEAVQLLEMYRRKVLRKVEKGGFQYYVESNGNIAFMTPVIRTLFPQSRIVHLVRNGVDYVRSMYSRRHNLKKGKGLAFTEKDPRKRLKADFFPEDPYFGKWEKMNRFERICWNWAKKDGKIMEEVKKCEGCRTFKFEDLFVERNPTTWHELIRFMGVEDQLISWDGLEEYLSAGKSNEVERHLIGDWSEWPPEKKEAFLRIAGSHMKECGYELPEDVDSSLRE